MWAPDLKLLLPLIGVQVFACNIFALLNTEDQESSLYHVSSPGHPLKCNTDEDCRDLLLCKSNVTNCYCNQKTTVCDWKDRGLRPRWRRSVLDNEVELLQDDIGPDTCGKDRKVLSNWFLTHGSPSLLEEPIPELVLPTYPNPFDDPNKPPLQPDEISGITSSTIIL